MLPPRMQRFHLNIGSRRRSNQPLAIVYETRNESSCVNHHLSVTTYSKLGENSGFYFLKIVNIMTDVSTTDITPRAACWL